MVFEVWLLRCRMIWFLIKENIENGKVFGVVVKIRNLECFGVRIKFLSFF